MVSDGPIALDQPCTQEAFGATVGISQQAVSDLMVRGILRPGEPLGAWLQAYCRRLRDQASGRDADGILAKERAALSRSQRQGQDIRNAKELGEWAPIGLLSDVLALASNAVVDRFDALPGQLRKVCPDLSADALAAIDKAIGSARGEWIRVTAQLVDQALDQVLDDGTEPDPVDEPDDDGVSA